jgi:hypothetical protein
VDFSKEITSRHPGGLQEELATIYSIVNTITENVPGVDRVRILIQGMEAESLAGHIALNRFFHHSPRYIIGGRQRQRLIQEENLQ